MLQAEIVPFRTDPRVIDVEVEAAPDSRLETEATAPGRTMKLPAARTGPRFANGDAGPLADPRHERYCQAYAATGNASQSYKTSGFTGASAEVLGGRLSRHPVVRARVDEIRREMGAEFEVSRSKALEWLNAVMLGRAVADPIQLSAAALLGRWCGFEAGSRASQANAEATRGIVDALRTLTNSNR